MKKLLVALLALGTVSAFSQTSMVRFTHDSGTTFSDFDFNTNNVKNDGGVKNKDSNGTNIALNYAYTVAPQVQVGLGLDYKNNGNTERGIVYTVSGFYNFDTDLANSNYVGLHYTFQNVDGKKSKLEGAGEKDTRTVIGLEYGQRIAMGSWNGFNFTFSPSVVYSMETIDFDAKGSKVETNNSLALNVLKFDVLF